MKNLITFSVLALLSLCACHNAVAPYDYVNAKIGSGGHGHVFVGASVPFGMVQVGPTSIPQQWDWCSGYHDSDSSVIGFSHTHLSGTGIGDLFDVTVMPVVGDDIQYCREGLSSQADRSQEIAEPAYYCVPLSRYGVIAEMTATERVGLERFTFPQGKEGHAIVFNLQDGGCWDRATDVDLKVLKDGTVVGHRHSSGWAKDQKLYFAAKFSEPAISCERKSEMFWRFDFAGAEQVSVKVALSPTGIDAALANMDAELPGWEFDSVRAQAREKWNNELSKISVSTTDPARKEIFYTALYHTMVMPFLFSDNGSPDRYTSLSLWDTYRAQMPLFTIIHADREVDVINSFLDIYDKQGDLPVWHLMGCETDCMVGNPGIPVVADAIIKGFEGFDKEKAFDAMKATAMMPDRGQDLRMKYGYIPYDLFPSQSVAFDMEYAIADAALAMAAEHMGKIMDYEYFLERSHSYRKYFDPSCGFIRGLDSKGDFKPGFNPYFSDHTADVYCEGNGWQYLWLVPHDIAGLEQCFNQCADDGRSVLISKLDSLFTVSSQVEGANSSPDISGLIGQYAHGNEPSHHVIYFYTLLGQPWKTADLVRKVLDTLYTTEVDGLCGNEDAGQMSAWYVLSSMGLYQVEPAGGRYYFGSPVFDEVSINVGDGKQFRIIAENNGAENKYISSIYLNGELYSEPYINYTAIMDGGELRFVMSDKQ